MILNKIKTLKEKLKTLNSKEKIVYIPSTVYDNKLLLDKNVLITGAGKNIGRSIALEMAKQGANIYFTDINEQYINHMEIELEKYQIKHQGFIYDISNIGNSDSLVNTLETKTITIDVLVNNVGIEYRKTGLQNLLNINDWKTLFDTNVFGPVYLTKLIAERMIESNNKGNLIFITSVHQETIRTLPSYSSSKSALKMLIKELAYNLAQHSIRVNGIAPGWVENDSQGNPLHFRKNPLTKSSIEADYIGRAAVYLASEYFSKYTTGTIIKIDSGTSLHNYVSL